MTFSIQYARRLSKTMQSRFIKNLVAQSKAKQILREVKELPEHFPDFDSELDERVTFLSYARLAAGCSLIERNQTEEGYLELHAAADMLEAAHRTEIENSVTSATHCLIGAMAFYACGQYSRAFVIIKKVEGANPSAGIISAFLRKDRNSLIARLNEILLSDAPDFEDALEFDEWALSVCLARAIALVIEHGISGDSGLLASADEVLNDAMLISKSGFYTAFWWQSRLLRLMLKDYSGYALWSLLPDYFDAENEVAVGRYIRLLAFQTPHVTELWRSQETALKLSLDSNNKGGVINLRTSAGKTRVAELAILHTLSADPEAKVLYLAPFRSLAFELERTFSKTLAPLGYHVSHLYGGLRFSSVDRELVKEGHITIATPEKTKAMLRAEPELFNSVKLIVIDEGHLLGDNERNIRNEIFIEYLRLLAQANDARILLLSAVLPNSSDLAAWVAGSQDALVKSDWKPSAERFGNLRWRKSGVSIEWLGSENCFNPHFVEFKKVPNDKGGMRKFPASKTEAVAATAVRLTELGPVLIFAGQARWVSSMARAVLLAMGEEAPIHPWPDVEWKLFEAVCKEELGDEAEELMAARYGVICHSNNLPPQVRISIEKLMAKCAPKIIVATTTLGQGVNIGISSVVFSTTSIGKEQISKRDFWNICGRAGRAFVDGEGKVLFAIDMTKEAWQIKNLEKASRDYFDRKKLDRVESGLLQIVKYLTDIARSSGVSFELLLEFVANNDFEKLGEHKNDVEGLLDWLDDQLLALHVAYVGDDEFALPEVWVDDAFRDSLAAIQERSNDLLGGEKRLIKFFEARAIGVLRKTPVAARRAVISSGLPLSVGLAAFGDLEKFRGVVDRYLDSNFDSESLDSLVSEFETWARDHNFGMSDGVPTDELLTAIRPQWLSGAPLKEIADRAGEEAFEICSGFYGYQLPWLLHAIAQKFDKESEENRIEALSKISVLVELGLPTEAAAKIYLAGVRSRTAAVELGPFVVNPAASINTIRRSLLNPDVVSALSDAVSKTTVEWLHLLSDEHGVSEDAYPRCPRFHFSSPVPDAVGVLHARRNSAENRIYLCSTDARFKLAVRVSKDLPFDKLADDLRFAFIRDGDSWVQEVRDPRLLS